MTERALLHYTTTLMKTRIKGREIPPLLILVAVFSFLVGVQHFLLTKPVARPEILIDKNATERLEESILTYGQDIQMPKMALAKVQNTSDVHRLQAQTEIVDDSIPQSIGMLLCISTRTKYF